MKYETKRLMGILTLLAFSACGPAIDPPKEEGAGAGTSTISGKGEADQEKAPTAEELVAAGDQSTAEKSAQYVNALQQILAEHGFVLICKPAADQAKEVCQGPEQAKLNDLLKPESLKKMAEHSLKLEAAYKTHMEKYPQDPASARFKIRLEALNASFLIKARELEPKLYDPNAPSEEELGKEKEAPVAPSPPNEKKEEPKEPSELPTEPKDIEVKLDGPAAPKVDASPKKEEVKVEEKVEELEEPKKESSSAPRSDKLVQPSSKTEEVKTEPKKEEAPAQKKEESGSKEPTETSSVDPHANMQKSMAEVIKLELALNSLGLRFVKNTDQSKEMKAREKKCDQKKVAHFHADWSSVDSSKDAAVNFKIAKQLIGFEAALVESLNRYGSSTLADDFRLKLDEVKEALQNARKNQPELFIELDQPAQDPAAKK